MRVHVCVGETRIHNCLMGTPDFNRCRWLRDGTEGLTPLEDLSPGPPRRGGAPRHGWGPRGHSTETGSRGPGAATTGRTAGLTDQGGIWTTVPLCLDVWDRSNPRKTQGTLASCLDL